MWGGTAVRPLERSPLLTSSSSRQTSYTHTHTLHPISRSQMNAFTKNPSGFREVSLGPLERKLINVSQDTDEVRETRGQRDVPHSASNAGKRARRPTPRQAGGGRVSLSRASPRIRPKGGRGRAVISALCGRVRRSRRRERGCGAGGLVADGGAGVRGSRDAAAGVVVAGRPARAAGRGSTADAPSPRDDAARSRGGGYPRREFVPMVKRKTSWRQCYFTAPSKFKLHTHVTKKSS